MSTLFDDDFDTLEIDSPDQNHLRKYHEKNKNLEGIWMILKNRKAEQNGPFNYLNIRGVN